jgi:isochorismate pyruvate lyase
MTELRVEIDALDRDLVALLVRRAAYIDRAITLKQREALPARIDDRVAEVLDRVRRRAEADGLDGDLAETLWRHLIDWSIAREERVLGRDDGKEPTP